MPAYIRMTKISKRHLALPICRREKESLFVISRWADARAIIKTVMIKHHHLLIQITSDREIRDVGVGSTSRTARADDDKQLVYNSLSDLVDPADLLVVRLNELKYKNRAASGFLEEALSYRVDRGKPTWVVSDPTDPFGASSHAFSQSIWELLHTCYEKTEIPQILHIPTAPSAEVPKPGRPSNPEPDGIELENIGSPEPSIGAGAKKPGRASPPPRRKTEESEDDDSLGSKYGGGRSSKKSW